MSLRPHFFDLVECDPIVATHFQLLPHLAEILREVISKGIVVVEQQKHGDKQGYRSEQALYFFQCRHTRHSDGVERLVAQLLSFAPRAQFPALSPAHALCSRFPDIRAQAPNPQQRRPPLGCKRAPLRHQSPKRNARIHVAGEIKIHHRARVDTATRRFEFVNNFHRADFRRARNGSRRKARHQRLEAIHPRRRCPRRLDTRCITCE